MPIASLPVVRTEDRVWLLSGGFGRRRPANGPPTSERAGKCHRLFRVPAMFDMNQLGKLLIVIGLVIAAIGLALFLSGKIPWFGRLPGDIVYRGKNVTFYFPLMTSLAVSVILTLILWFINRR